MFVWLWLRPGGEEAAIRRRLDQLAAEINSSAGGGLDTLGRAAQIGSYFSDDVVIDLGRGASPIEGRAVLMNMAARLQPRTSRFDVKFTDINVRLSDATDAAVELTAEIIPRDESGGHMDAREFSAELTKADGEWRIRRATAVQALR